MDRLVGACHTHSDHSYKKSLRDGPPAFMSGVFSMFSVARAQLKLSHKPLQSASLGPQADRIQDILDCRASSLHQLYEL